MKSFNLKILHTSDIHGNIHPYSYADNKKTNSLCNASTFINSIRNENTLLIDTGDLIQGSALTYFHNKNYKTSINPMAKVLIYLNYDCMVLGNHEFSYGQAYLEKFIDDVNTDIIANNVYKYNKLYLKPYKVKILENGFKIVIIGSVIDKIPLWERECNILNLYFKDVLEALTESISYIKKYEKPDCIIFAYHGGFEINPSTEQQNEIIRENVGYEVLKNNTDIDILLTGHQHKKYVGIENEKAYTQPACYGKYVGEININYNFNNGTWTKGKIKADLVNTENYIEDKNLIKINKNLEKKTQKWLDKKIGILADGDIIPTTPLMDRVTPNKLFTFINKIQIEASGVDISCTALGNNFIGLKKEITTRQILNSYKYTNCIVVLKIKGDGLLEALEHNAKFFELDEKNNIKINDLYEKPRSEYYNYDVYYGIDYSIDLKADVGKRVKAFYKEEEIDINKEYLIVCNNYRASGGGGFNMFEKCEVVKEISKEMSDLIIDYITEKKNNKTTKM